MPASDDRQPVAVVSGIGPGLGRALCRRLHKEGFAVVGLARSPAFGEQLAAQLSASDGQNGSFRFLACDVTDRTDVTETLARISEETGPLSLLIHNAGQLLIKPFAETTPEAFEAMRRVTALGAMLTAQAVLPGMAASGDGTVIFTGATAGLRGGANFAAFASAKFALRGLAQSLAREYGPRGVHVVHANVDGIMWGGISRDQVNVGRDRSIEPDAVADAYLYLMRQPRSAWTHEIDLRPHCEAF